MKSDNVQVLAEYYEKQYETLLKKIHRRAGGYHNAEDVVQEAFARALVYIGNFDPARNMGAWFNTILMNALKDFNQQERNQGGIRVEEEFSDEVDDIMIRRDCVEAIASEVDEMPEPNREIIRQFVFLGYRAKSISRHLQVNIHTVRKTIQDFYNDIRQRYGAPA